MIGAHAEIDPTSTVLVKTFHKLPRVAAMGEWSTSGAGDTELAQFGFKVDGGGPHQSKTMMLSDFSTLLAGNDGEAPGPAILDHNALGKPSARARKAALDNLRRLYAAGADAPIGVVLRRLWGRDPESRPLLALLCALARDPLLRAGSSAVLDAKLGEQVKAPAIAAVVEAANSGRFSRKMSEVLSRNAASSWTQAGFLKGAIRKERIRPQVNPVVAAYAALLANLAGFGGMRLLESRWLDVLDRPVEERLVLLRQAEGLGLVRVRSAGDVLEIEVRRTMANATEVASLVHG